MSKKASTKKPYTGINIQFPISQLILSGEKTVETRTYSIPVKYLGKDMVIIETPGKPRKFKARIVAIIRFSECFQYKNSEQFYLDIKRHCVTPNSEWAWITNKPKWGWVIAHVKVLAKYQTITKRIGIKYTTRLNI